MLVQVLEVVAEEEAEERLYTELLGSHPSEASQEERISRLKAQEEESGRIAALQREVQPFTRSLHLDCEGLDMRCEQ